MCPLELLPNKTTQCLIHVRDASRSDHATNRLPQEQKSQRIITNNSCKIRSHRRSLRVCHMEKPELARKQRVLCPWCLSFDWARRSAAACRCVIQILNGPDKDWGPTTKHSNECLPALALANVVTVKYCTVCLGCLRDGCPKLMANATLRHTMQNTFPKLVRCQLLDGHFSDSRYTFKSRANCQPCCDTRWPALTK